MYLLLLRYLQPLDAIDRLLDDHVAFLEKYYDRSNFICSGRRVPRVGGVILARAESEEEVRAIVQEDPFVVHGAAEYEIIAFTPTKYAPEFANIVAAPDTSRMK